LLSAGACASLVGSRAPPTYDLTAPRDFPRASRHPRGQLVIAEPTALSIFDSERIVIRSAGEQVSYLTDAQWSDRLPRLVHTRIVQAFENANRLRAVGRPGDKVTADFQLLVDVRAFQVTVGETVNAEVELSAKVVSDRSGRIFAAQVFRTVIAVPDGTTGPAAIAALETAFQRVAVDMVLWAARLI
jgi:cholesterol transport system auxiliary component